MRALEPHAVSGSHGLVLGFGLISIVDFQIASNVPVEDSQDGQSQEMPEHVLILTFQYF